MSASPAKERHPGATGAAPGSSGGPPVPEPPRRSALVPLLFGLFLAAAVGFLIWYLLVRDDETPAVAPLPEPGEVTLDVERLDFGDEDVGGVSVMQRVLLTNGTATAVRVEDVVLAGEAADDYELLDPGCVNARLRRGDACAVSVRFRPTTTGGRSARLVFSLDGGPGERAVDLAGVGSGRALLLAESSRLDFGRRALETDGEPRQLVLVNAGEIALHIRRAVVQGPSAADYRLGRRARCLGGQELPAGESCVLNVSFTPAQAGARAAVLLLFHDAAEAPTRIQLRGEGAGTAAAVLSPASVTFDRAALGETGEPRALTLRNGGTAPLSVAWIAVSGPDEEDFLLLPGGTCEKGRSLDPGGSCTLAVRFRPTAAGRRTAALVVAGDDPAGFAEAGLTGTATPPPQEAATPGAEDEATTAPEGGSTVAPAATETTAAP